MRGLFSIISLCIILLYVAPLHGEASVFKDVRDNHSLQYEIEYLVDQEIISGYADGTFRPSSKIKKKHVTAMLVKALHVPMTNVQNPGYQDVSSTHPYYKVIAAAYTAGLFKKADLFHPEDTITRADMAQLLATGFKLKQNGTQTNYVDVGTTHPNYKAIQAISSNSIARGSYTENNELQFHPNATLTRAHFAAFLARALTLNAKTYLPAVGHNYVFEFNTGERYLYENQYDYYWIGYNENGEEVDRSVYGIESGIWFEGIPQSDVGFFVEYPFTIGMKYNYLDGDGAYGKLTVLNTNASVTVNGQPFNEVVVVEEQYYEFNLDDTKNLRYQRIYIAQNYGIVKIESGDVGKKPDWFKQLVERIPIEIK